MIIILDGPINAGKSTVGALLAKRLSHAVHIEVDHLRHFARGLTLEQAIPYALADAVSLTKAWVDRGFQVIVSWPIERANMRHFAAVAAESGAPLFVFTLLPRVEVALGERGRRLKDDEKARIKEMYARMYAGMVAGQGAGTNALGQPAVTIIDNSDQGPEETVQAILDHVQARTGGDKSRTSLGDRAYPVFSISDRPAPADAAYIRQRIKEFNDSVSEHHRLARTSGKEPLAALMHDSAGELIGGLFASIYWGWLDLDELWIAERWRGAGHGRTLMRLVEDAAVKRNCRLAQVRTWDFQARGFYERFGYTVAGRMEDYPPGRTFYWLRKELPGRNS